MDLTKVGKLPTIAQRLASAEKELGSDDFSVEPSNSRGVGGTAQGQAPVEARAESEEVAMSNATDMHKHETRMMLANSITSVLVYRFPWLRVNATADYALRAYLVETIVSKHDSGLTIESAMGAMLDALQAENAEVKRQFVAYVNNHGPCQVR